MSRYVAEVEEYLLTLARAVAESPFPEVRVGEAWHTRGTSTRSRSAMRTATTLAPCARLRVTCARRWVLQETRALLEAVYTLPKPPLDELVARMADAGEHAAWRCTGEVLICAHELYESLRPWMLARQQESQACML